MVIVAFRESQLTLVSLYGRPTAGAFLRITISHACATRCAHGGTPVLVDANVIRPASLSRF
jgi:hypothetical protein